MSEIIAETAETVETVETKLEAQSDEAKTEETVVQPEPEVILPQKPIIAIKCATDGSKAEIELMRTATETLNPTREDIEAALAEHKIVYGIDQKYIDFLCERPSFNQSEEIAKGKPATVGEDGYIKYLIETKKELKPKIRPDGTTDYFDLGFIHNVKTGEPLCEVHNPTKGEDGYNIFGVLLEGAYGREPDIPIGLNTEFDKEIFMVVATVDGNVDVDRKGIINVYDILRITGNVDNSTGSINFVGDIVISGDVLSGFKVESQGSIAVKGTVEGAHLKAKGDITVGQSINGMNRARIMTDGNVKCKYIQNSHMEIGGDIFADSIMHCIIECDGNIELTGKRGSLIGGKTVVSHTIVAKGIGTESHVATHVTMAGGGLGLNKKINKIKKEISAIDTELIMLHQTILWCEDLKKKGTPLKPFQINAYEQGRVRMVTIAGDREVKIKELEEVQSELNSIDPATCFIKCSGRIHTGVRIVFGMQIMNVQASVTNSRVMLIDGEIVVMSL